MQRNVFVLACFLVCADCFAQQYPFVYYTPRDGLINSRVRVIKQDRQGRMYFITHGGLSVYDGKRFINYDRRHGLANEFVNDIAEVGPDSFLLATNAAMLNTLIRGQIGIFKTADNFYPVINGFFQSKDGTLFAAADEGLYFLQRNRFVSLPLLDKQGEPTGCCLGEIEEWDNYLLLIPWNHDIKEKLILYDRLAGKAADILFNKQVTGAVVDNQRQVWLTTTEGLYLMDTAAMMQGKISLLPVPPKFQNVTSSKSALLLFDAADKAWCFSEGRLSIFSPQQTQVISSGGGLKTTTNIFVDREGTLWLATDGNGAIKLRNTNIELVNNIDQKPLFITGMSKQNDTVWFYNSNNNSMYRFCDNKYSLFPLPARKTPIGNICVRGKRIYLGTGEELYYVEDKDDPRSYLRLLPLFKSRPEMRLGSSMNTSEGFMIQYAVEDARKYYLYVLKHDSMVMKYQVGHAIDGFCRDKSGRLWITTRDSRIFAFTLHPAQPGKYLQLVDGYPKELPKLDPRSITVDANYNVWIGTRYNGLYQFRCEGNQLIQVLQFTTENGLTDNFVSTLACDSTNSIWAGTQTGIDKIYRKNDRYIVGNVSKSNHFFQFASQLLIAKDNTVWGLTYEAILKVSQADSPKMATTPPPLILTSLEVNNQPYNGGAGKLTYHQNNLSFSVAAPSFVDERSINYSYLLEGSGNPTWSKPGNNATFNFINLSPGNYTLKIRSDFPELLYPPQFLSYGFSIHPPWWQTWWFRIGMGLSILALLIFITRSYYSRKLEKQKNKLERKQAVEKERTRIATDMHDELGAGLSRIKFLSETIGLKKQMQEPVEEDIDKIRQYSHEMIDKMGEIVWALNEKNDSLSDLLAYTRVYAVQYLSENGIHCSVDTPVQFPSSFISGEFRRNIYLTVKEALHNIVKHAQARQVTIQMETGKTLFISISDDGTGFDQNNIRPYGNGLNNMKKRMESIEGILEIKNGNGTTIIISAPIS
jgi:signal transduction histidine kinase/ligand-binding sensor domain-containing protein